MHQKDLNEVHCAFERCARIISVWKCECFHIKPHAGSHNILKNGQFKQKSCNRPMQRYEILTENYDILVLDCVVFNENRTQWIKLKIPTKMNINIWTEKKKKDNGYERQKQRDHGYIFDVHSKSNHKIKKNVKHWNRAAFTIHLYWHFLEVFANHRNNIWQNRCMISMNFKWGRKKRWKRARRKEEERKSTRRHILAISKWKYGEILWKQQIKQLNNDTENRLDQRVCKAEINCISFCYLLLRTNSHFKLNICHICILYVNFLFFD